MSEELSELLKVRRDKLAEFKARGMDPFPYRFERDSNAAQIQEKFGHLQGHEESPKEVKIAGRVMTKRGHGKACFLTLQDDTGRLQVYAKEDVIGPAPYELFYLLDMGDIIGVTGPVFRTKMGELTVRITKWTLLCKSLHPLPEKWHGLQDKELRYRERYVDLMVNPDVKEVFVKRSRILSSIRKFLEGRGFMEVETPLLHVLQGGAAATPFETYHDALSMPLFLRIAPELYLKRLMVGGFEKIFELGRVFRNEGMSFKHNPEYTMLEVYEAYADYQDVLIMTEEMISNIIKEASGGYKVDYKGETINFEPPYKKIPLIEALKHFGNIDISGKTDEQIRQIGKDKGIEGALEIGVGRSSTSSTTSSWSPI